MHYQKTEKVLFPHFTFGCAVERENWRGGKVENRTWGSRNERLEYEGARVWTLQPSLFASESVLSDRALGPAMLRK
jgi:hypothetical protein